MPPDVNGVGSPTDLTMALMARQLRTDLPSDAFTRHLLDAGSAASRSAADRTTQLHNDVHDRQQEHLTTALRSLAERYHAQQAAAQTAPTPNPAPLVLAPQSPPAVTAAGQAEGGSAQSGAGSDGSSPDGSGFGDGSSSGRDSSSG